MRSSFLGIETAKRSLFTQQAALNTTGHNIANANTPGFSRQRVNMTASLPMEVPGLTRSNVPGQLGTGVEFGSITRVRETFLDNQYRNEYTSLGSWKVQSDTLDKLQAIMNEPSDTGIRTVLDKFWNAWAESLQNPENDTARKILRETTIALTNSFNQTSKQLSDLNGDLTSNIDVKASEINTTIRMIASLNSQIAKIEGLGNDANDLRDQRDLLTDQLSGIVNITITNAPSGYIINMGGTNLVNGGTASPLSSAGLESAFQSGDLNGGEVYGMMISRDQYVSDYQKQMDILANTIANGEVTVTIPAGSVIPNNTTLNTAGGPQTYSGTVAQRTLSADTVVTINGVNGLHNLGYLFTTPSSTGGDFFTAKAGFSSITAASIELNPSIQADVTLIATSMRTDDSSGSEVTIKGNNTLAVLMAQLKDSRFTFAGGSSTGVLNGTLDDYYRSIVGQMGVQASEASRQTKNQQSLVDQVDSRRQSVSGVSLDEEMSSMIMFQHAYGAAARFMTTYDQILDKLINGTGTVGR